jgi:hypothetical protein
VTLPVTDAWKKAMGLDGRFPVYWLQIDLGGGSIVHATKGWSSDATIGSYAGAIDEITPITAAFDPVTREVQVQSVAVTFKADGWARALIIANRLKRKAVTIKVGTRTLGGSDFASRFVGVIDGTPKPLPDGRIRMKVASAMAWLRDAKVQGYWPGLHPLEAMVDIFTKVGLPSSLYDSASFDPSDSRYSSVSHFVVQRGGGGTDYFHDQAVTEPTSAMQLIEELCSTMNSAVVAMEDGKLKHVFFDSTAAIVETFTDADISDIEIESLDANLINRASLAFQRDANQKTTQIHVTNDTASQSTHAYSDGSTSIVANESKTGWLEAISYLITSMTAGSPAAGGTYQLSTRQLFGFCGTRWPGFSSGSQPAWAKPSVSRLVYHKIGDELVACNAVTVGAVHCMRDTVVDPFDGSLDALVLVANATFTVSARGSLATAAAAHTTANPATPVYDYTIPVWKTQQLVTRFSNGAPVIRIVVPPHRGYPVQLGDLVGVVTDRYCAYGVSSLDATTKWEVIGKEADFENASVTLTLCWATSAAPPAVVVGSRAGPSQRYTPHRDMDLNVEIQPAMRPAVQTGFTLSAGAGLTLNVAAGTWTYLMQARSKDAATLTMIASSDNYVYIAMASGMFIVKSVAVAAGEPAQEPGLLKLGKVTTGGAAISAINDERVTTLLKGAVLIPQSVGQAPLAKSAVGVTVLNTASPLKKSLVSNPNFALTTRG